jgi:hypothetical protein
MENLQLFVYARFAEVEMDLNLEEMRVLQILAGRHMYPELATDPLHELSEEAVLAIYLRLGNAILDWHKQRIPEHLRT